jgi:hypothetical protein
MDALVDIKRIMLPYSDSKIVYMNDPVTILQTTKADSEDTNLAKNASNDGTTSVVPFPLSFLLIVSVCKHDSLLIGCNCLRCTWNWENKRRTDR